MLHLLGRGGGTAHKASASADGQADKREQEEETSFACLVDVGWFWLVSWVLLGLVGSMGGGGFFVCLVSFRRSFGRLLSGRVLDVR